MSEEQTRAPVAYVLVRKDLDINAQAVHVGHARAESILVAPIDKRTITRVLWVKHAAELMDYHAALVLKKYPVALVQETDGTYAGQATALGVAPLTERLSGLGRLFYHLESMDLEALAFERFNDDRDPPREHD